MAWQGLFGWLAERSAMSDYNKLVDEYMNRQQGNQQAPSGLLGPMSDALPYGAEPAPWQQAAALPQQQQQPGGSQFPQEFYLKAAGIPGFEHLAAGALQNQGAMERLQTQNTWERDNMTAYQRGSLGEQARQWENISPYQQAALNQQADASWMQYDLGDRGLSQGLTIAQMNDQRQREIIREQIAARAQQAQLQREANSNKGLLGKLPEGMMYYEGPGGVRMGYQPGAPGGQKVFSDVSTIVNGLNSLDTYRDYASLPSLWQGYTDNKLRGRAAMAHGDLLAAIGKSRDLGTMQKSDLEFVSKNLFDPGAVFGGSMPGSKGKAVGAVDFSKEKLLGSLEQLARQYPELYASPEAGAWRNYVAQYQQYKQQQGKKK